MKLNQAPGCAVALLIAAGCASLAEGFYLPLPTVATSALAGRDCGIAGVPAGGRGTLTVGCTCAACSRLRLGEASGGRAGAATCVAAAGGDGVGEGSVAAAVAGFGLDDETLEELWTRPRKHLLSVGKAGVKPSHVRSLNALVEAHTLVKVKINIPRADFDDVGLQLCGRPTPEVLSAGEGAEQLPQENGVSTPPTASSTTTSVSVVLSRTKQNMILFAKTNFLADLAEGSGGGGGGGGGDTEEA